jgi:hypothetical protein
MASIPEATPYFNIFLLLGPCYPHSYLLVRTCAYGRTQERVPRFASDCESVTEDPYCPRHISLPVARGDAAVAFSQARSELAFWCQELIT